MIPSPVTGGQTKLLRTIPGKLLVSLYHPYVDVARFFTTVPDVQVYECCDTGYQFYYPYTLMGDGPFYETLSKETLYYIPWKWEHAITDTYIAPNDTVLELGCANGDFLATLKERKNIIPFGTEINDAARTAAEGRGISFSRTSNADVACAFQVLEHIADVRTFIQDAVSQTKVGGYVIFGIPNNDSFLKDDPICFLNMPPHHMGLWTEHSLRAIAPLFDLEVVAIEKETLQPQHYRYYYQVYFGNRFIRYGFLGKVFNKIIYTLFTFPLIALRAHTITGHTIMAIYKRVK